jgi:anthranilate synthase/aminodeoxychorismate synthase-like glutamine amidotransferase
MILLIDNYDSFVFNLARYFERLGHETLVVRNDATSVDHIQALAPGAVVLSPGPCSPSEAGCSLDVVRGLAGKLPIFGVCLGHQAIAAAFGARIVRAAEPIHGRTSEIFHAGKGLFADLPNPMTACRYHSLIVARDTLEESLEVTAWTADGTVMAIEHRAWPVVGVQFHPESILTDCGYALVAAFLRRAGLPVPEELPTIAWERSDPAPVETQLPTVPITF